MLLPALLLSVLTVLPAQTAAAAAAVPPAATVPVGVDGPTDPVGSTGSVLEVPIVVPPADGVLGALASDAGSGPGSDPAAPDVGAAPDATQHVDAATTDEPVVAEARPGDTRAETAVIESDGFSLIGLTWPSDADVAALDAQFRTRDGDDWSAWSPLEPSDESPDPGTSDAAAGAHGGTDPVWAGASDAVQMSFAVTAAGGPEGLSVALVDPGSDPVDAPRAPGADTAAASTLAAAVEAAPAIVTRAEWGAPATTPCAPDTARGLVGAVVHHSASSNAYASPAEARAAIRGFYRFHTESRGWCDLGYNFLVDKWGTIYEGRAGSLTAAVIGVHAGGFNTGTVGVSMIGDYSSVAPSAATLDSVSRVIAWRLAAYGVDPQASMSYRTGGGENSVVPANTSITLPVVFAHRDVAATACPGQRGYAAMGQIRARAGELARALVSLPQSGRVAAVAGSTVVPGMVVEIRDAQCQRVFSTMRTGADGTFPVSAFPGAYCAVPVAAPSGFGLPPRRTFTVVPGVEFRVELQVPAAPSSGTVVVSGRGTPVAGAVFEVRNATCSTVFSTMRTGADGSFGVTAYPGSYCLTPVSVPAPFELPGTRTFTVAAGQGFTVAVGLSGPVTGEVVVTGGGRPVAGAVLEVRSASCTTTFSRMRTGTDGSFPVTAYPGSYCLVPVSVPAPFDAPGAQVFTVDAGGFRVPVGLSQPFRGKVVVTGGGGAVAGAVFEVRSASCTTTFSRMRTGTDGSFPVTAYPGSYCLVPVSVPSPFEVPGSRVFTVGSAGGFSVPVGLAGPSLGRVVATGGSGPVAGAVFEVRSASCATTFSTMRTGADGSFPVLAGPGTYCLVPVAVPAGYAMPARRTFAVAVAQRFTASVTLARA